MHPSTLTCYFMALCHSSHVDASCPLPLCDHLLWRASPAMFISGWWRGAWDLRAGGRPPYTFVIPSVQYSVPGGHAHPTPRCRTVFVIVAGRCWWLGLVSNAFICLYLPFWSVVGSEVEASVSNV